MLLLKLPRFVGGLAGVILAVTATAAAAQTPPASTATAQLVCASRPGERQTCAADTSAGVTLVTVLGAAVCEQARPGTTTPWHLGIRGLLRGRGHREHPRSEALPLAAQALG